jgi:hypothetical protein
MRSDLYREAVWSGFDVTIHNFWIPGVRPISIDEGVRSGVPRSSGQQNRRPAIGCR